MAANRIAALVGDFYHEPEAMRDTLRQAAGQVGFELQTFTDPAELPWSALGDFRGLIIAKENRIAPAESNAVWATPKHESAISEFAAAGGAVIALHNGLASYDVEGDYFRTMRGGFLFHPKEHPRFQVRALPVGHPVLSGFKEFDLVDEMYFVRVDSARTTRLLELAHVDYGTSCAAWAHEAGRGRVFCFSPGHTTEVLNHPGYRRFLDHGLRWALRVEKS
ncbi:MAG: ThuA domain-containing protein [Spirochaetia bacterium]|jgi:type 1 glutamine amidotransferase